MCHELATKKRLHLCHVGLHILYFHFHSILYSSLFSYWLLSWLNFCLVVSCSVSKSFYTYCSFCCFWNPWWSDWMQGDIWIFLYLLRLPLGPSTWSILEKVLQTAVKKKVFSGTMIFEVFLDINIWSGLSWVGILLRLLFPLWIPDNFGRWGKQSVSIDQWIKQRNRNGLGWENSRTESEGP